MLNLQQKNLLELVAALSHRPGWETLQARGLTALAAPVQHPFINTAWGEASREHLEACRAFFKGMPYAWFLEPGMDGALLEAAGFRRPERVPEMVHDLVEATFPEPAAGITTLPAECDPDTWSSILGTNFRIPTDHVSEFFRVVHGAEGSVALLGFLDGNPAATALLHVGKESAAIHSMSTLPDYRGQGLASALVRACLGRAREAGHHRVALYASPMGCPLYGKLDFRTVQVLEEYHSPGYPYVK